MKHKSYKHIITLLAICCISSTFAQKFDKKFTETFKTNKDVEVAINASYTDINVTTWDKNEVQVNAFIEVEGISKKEAEKYFKNWNFEALGNSKKVQVTSKGNNSFSFKNDFVFFDNMDFDINIPEIDFADIETIVIPEMKFDFNFDNLLEDIEDIDKTMGKNGKYEFRWKDDENDIEINSKEEWEAFKKTKKYKELKERMKIDKEKVRIEFAKSKEKMKQAFEKSKKVKIDKEKIKKELAKAKEVLKTMKLGFNTEDNDIIINGKKVKIKKRIEIKVPKAATFDLNTRHCKVKLPNTVAFGNVKYGTFDANNLLGGKLTVDYSPVSINDLNACTLFLNNVTDAKIASVTNTNLSNNSSGVKIIRINENVNVTDKFGELVIESFNPNFGEFILNLSNSNAILNLGNVASKFKYSVNRVKLDNKRAAFGKENKASNNIIHVKGDYSSIVIK